MSYVRVTVRRAFNIGSVYHASMVGGCVPMNTHPVLSLLVSQTPSLGSDASPPPPLHEAVVIPMKTAFCFQLYYSEQ